MKINAYIRRSRTGLTAAALLLCILGAALFSATGGRGDTSDAVICSSADISVSCTDEESAESAAPPVAAEEIPLEDCVGGEYVSMSDTEICQAIPANVRLDRLVVDAEAAKPLDSAWISSLFGYRKNPVSGKYTFHTGLDLAAPGGANIYAMYGGTVKTASFDKGYGNYIILDHGSWQTLYAHCSKLKRSKGDKVSRGDVIALVGSTGNSTGNHLHVEFRRDGQRYDPEWILGGIYS